MYANSYIKAFIAKILQNQMANIFEKLNNLDENCDNPKFHEIRIEFKKLRYLCDTFSSLFDIPKFDKFLSNLRYIQEIFGDLQDRDIWLMILDKYFSFDEKFEEYKNQILQDIEKFRSEILGKKCKIAKKLNKFQEIFKMYYEGNL